MYTFKKTPGEDYCKYDSTTVELSTTQETRDEIIQDFCSFMGGCGFRMEDISAFVFDESEEREEIFDLEMELGGLRDDIIDLQDENSGLKEKVEELLSVIESLRFGKDDVK